MRSERESQPVAALATEALYMTAKHGSSTALATTHMHNGNVSDRDIGVNGRLSVRHRDSVRTESRCGRHRPAMTEFKARLGKVVYVRRGRHIR